MADIVIKVSEEFEEQYASDRFEDSLQRLRHDIHKAIIAAKKVLSTKNEIKILDMLTESFLNSTSLEKHDAELLGKIRAEITDWQIDIHDNEHDAEIHDFVFERIYEIIDEYKGR